MKGFEVKACALRSGSSGNSTFIGCNQTRLLVDAGISAKSIEQSLRTIGETASDLNGILVTHEHSDHIAGVGVMMRCYQLPVYATQETWQAIRDSIGRVNPDLIHVIEPNRRQSIGDLVFSGFPTPHDAASPVGYRIETPGGDISVFTDIGFPEPSVLSAVSGSKLVFIEANYDHEMLMGGSYPAMLKERIAGRYGHLSNDECATAVHHLLESGTCYFALSHISQENNHPDLALLTVNSRLETVGARVGQDLLVDIARRHTVSNPFIF